MGKQNRARRAEKKRRAGSRQGQGQPNSHRYGHDFDGKDKASTKVELEAVVESLLINTARNFEARNNPYFEALINELPANPKLVDVLDPVLDSIFDELIRAAWTFGWQPAEYVTFTSRRLDDRSRQIIVNSVAHQSLEYLSNDSIYIHPDWHDQINEIIATANTNWSIPFRKRRPAPPDFSLKDELIQLVALINRFMTLPKIPTLIEPPGTAPQTIDLRTARPTGNKVLDRVRAMLAKAESTEFAEEADALVAKVQELMTRHSIDHAMVHGTSSDEKPTARRISIEDPYAGGKSLLLTVVAHSNACKAIWMSNIGFSTVFGFSDDIEAVEVLYTSLLVQATAEMTRRGSVRDASGKSITRSFRASFFDGFSQRISERLDEAKESATESAVADLGAGVSVVLASRESAVEDAVSAMFENVRQVTGRIRNGAGYVAGKAAADTAELNPYERLSASRKAIS